MSGKQLEDYTLREIQAICQTVHCEGCPGGKVSGTLCPLSGRADAWMLRPLCITKDERELLRLTGAKFVSRDSGGVSGQYVYLWDAEPSDLGSQEGKYFSRREGPGPMGRLTAALFPSIPPGVCWNVAELLGDKDKEE